MSATHVMVDLETLGTAPGSVLLSIGACAFDPEAFWVGPKFYRVIDRASCEAVGLTVDPATVAWWEKQSAEARAAIDAPGDPLVAVLADFTLFWKLNEGVEFWGHGANFDDPMLAAAYRACGLKPPWAFWNSRCTRTIFAAAGVKPDRSKGVHHQAVTDAVNQAEAVNEAFYLLGLAKRPFRAGWRRFWSAVFDMGDCP